MQTIKLRNGTLTLPPETAEKIEADAEFSIISTGDTIILKKIRPSRLSEIAERAPKDKAMSLAEIAREIHHYRRSRRASRR